MCDLTTIIVNYNTALYLLACLKSIAPPHPLKMEVIVVDNASVDRSVPLVTREFPWVKLIANEENLGFAQANNQALKSAQGRYVCFLNPDTLVEKGAFEAMADFMSFHRDVGMAGMRILNPDGSVQSSVERRYPGQKRARHDLIGLPGDIAWVLGAAMVARRSILESLGGFDGRFFLYGEEQDLCLRIRRAGWKIGFIPDAVVVHWGGQSERNTVAKDLWKKKFKAELLFYERHYSKRSIRRIHRANVLQALWRVFSLKMTLPLHSNKEASLEKLEKYRLASKMFRFWNA